MTHFNGLSGVGVPVMDVCFYGQYGNDKWFRRDELHSYDTSVGWIRKRALEIQRENLLTYISWGLDSKVFVVDAITNEESYVGNILQLDFDGKIDFDFVLKRIAFLKEDGLIRTNPDIAKSGHGYHVWIYELFDFDMIRTILVKPYIQDFLCEKFLRTTLYLRSSVLRLSAHKYGNPQPIKIIEYGYADGLVGNLCMRFVRGCLE